jgi:hypothetical protein
MAERFFDVFASVHRVTKKLHLSVSVRFTPATEVSTLGLLVSHAKNEM